MARMRGVVEGVSNLSRQQAGNDNLASTGTNG